MRDIDNKEVAKKKGTVKREVAAIVGGRRLFDGMENNRKVLVSFVEKGECL